MKMYLEIIEQLSDEEMGVKQPQILRIEVQTEDEALLILDSICALFEGLNITKKIHFCKHEEGLPCEVKEII